MARRTLIDFFEDLSDIPGQFLSFDDGYRSWSYTYRATTDRARAFASRLHDEGIGHGQHVVIWSENRPEWIMALWGCLLRDVVLVPIDYRASPEFLRAVAGIVNARAVLVGDTVPALSGLEAPLWKLSALSADTAAGPAPAVEHAPEDVAEVIFTSGATSQPKEIVLTHRNILANIVPI